MSFYALTEAVRSQIPDGRMKEAEGCGSGMTLVSVTSEELFQDDINRILGRMIEKSRLKFKEAALVNLRNRAARRTQLHQWTQEAHKQNSYATQDLDCTTFIIHPKADNLKKGSKSRIPILKERKGMKRSPHGARTSRIFQESPWWKGGKRERVHLNRASILRRTHNLKRLRRSPRDLPNHSPTPCHLLENTFRML